MFPEVQEPEEHLSPWAEDFEREPNPDAEPLHLAYDSVYTHEGDVREELLENWVEASASGKRWRCWNCGRNTQRFAQLRLPTLRTVISICDNCSTWTVWDAWRDLANPRIFSFRQTIEETEPSPPREPGPGEAAVPPSVRSNGSGGIEREAPVVPAAQAAPFDERPQSADLTLSTSERPETLTAPEPSLQPSSPATEASPTEAEAVAAAKPRRPRASAATEAGEPKPRASRARPKKTEEPALGGSEPAISD